VAISPQTVANNAEVKRKWRLPFPVLSDAGNGYASELGLTFELPADLQEVYDGFGIDLPVLHDDTRWMLPVPTRLVVDAGGVVRSVDADADYTVRPEVEATLQVLRSLS
jgi:peroxiredoxin